MLRKRRAFSQQTALLVFEIRTWLIVSAWNACFIGDCFNIVRRRCIDTRLSDKLTTYQRKSAGRCWPSGQSYTATSL